MRSATTWTPIPHMRKLSQKEIKAQVEKCNEKIASATDIKPIWFRTPYGEYKDTVIKAVGNLNMYPIPWNVDFLGWKNPTPDQIANRVLTSGKPGFIEREKHVARQHAASAAGPEGRGVPDHPGLPVYLPRPLHD